MIPAVSTEFAMSGKRSKNRRRTFLKASLISLAVFAALVLGLHIWFVNNARRVIREMVATRSGGKLKLDLSQISYNFFTSSIQVKEVNLVSTDSLTQPASYRIRLENLSVRVGSFWPVLFN